MTVAELQRFAVELRAEYHEEGGAGHGRVLGHAAVFGQTAKLFGHYERIDRHAFDDVLADAGTDARALVNHDSAQLLGRQSAGTLKLDVDERGLAYDIDLPDTGYARDARELVRRGDITGGSFGFASDEDAEEWSVAPDGLPIRTVTKVTYLRDVSIVTFPAYEGTDVMLRSLTIEPRESPPSPELDHRSDNRSRLVLARARIHLPTKEQQ